MGAKVGITPVSLPVAAVSCFPPVLIIETAYTSAGVAVAAEWLSAGGQLPHPDWAVG